jgi:ATP-dependent exoDNAse (exonuclease V) beta subunit
MEFLVYKASAGSGKTYTLVKEYLKLALQVEDPLQFRKILAITFTNKAASEMKERVIATLRQLGENNKNVEDLKNSLSKELGVAENELCKRAATLLSTILHNYSDFSISTIDSFMHRVVKAFAHDLKLPINFTVEIDNETLLQQAIAQIIEKVGNDTEITNILVGFTLLKTDNEKSSNVYNELFIAASDLLKEGYSDLISKLNILSINDFLQIRNEIEIFQSKIENQMVEIGSAAIQLINRTDLEINSFSQGTKGIGAFFLKLSKFGSLNDFSPNTYHYNAINEDDWYSKKTPQETIKKIDSIKEDLRKYFLTAEKLWEKYGEEYVLNTLIKDSLFTIALLNEMSKIIDKMRNEEHIVHISEFSKRVAEVVFNEPVPFIYERLGEKFEHFLIDEFQDTSVLQWQNLLPLVENGLSQNADSLIVGDGKQAIYRFRGGDVEQFAHLPEPYPENLPTIQQDRYLLLKQHYSPKNLEINYRSKKEIIDFNNSFYNFIKENYLPKNYENVYLDNEQKSSLNKTGGYVNIQFIDGKISTEEKQLLNIKQCEKVIKELIAQKKYNYQDIAILTRTNANGSLIAASLLELGIPVVSNESLLLVNSHQVKFILSWLNVLIYENISVNLLAICNYLIERNCFDYNSISDLLNEQQLTENNIIQLLIKNNFNINVKKLRSLSIFEACNQLCIVFNLEINKNPFIQFFLESVWNLSKNKAIDIPIFLEWWEEKGIKQSIVLPQDANAVKVMSAHKSKGLQFPIVILPFAYGEKSKNNHTWVNNENNLPENLPATRIPISEKLMNTKFANVKIEDTFKVELDMINLLYVATTRAEDSLYIISGRNGNFGSLQKGWETYLEKYAEKINPTILIDKFIQWGDENFLNNRIAKKVNTYQINTSEIKVGNWQERITIAREANKIWELKTENNRLKYGKMLHYALSFVKFHGDEMKATMRMVEEGLITNNEINSFNQYLIKVTNHPELFLFFKIIYKIYNEKELLVPGNEMLRPDRVAENENEFVVIDYKTGKKNTKDQHQVKKYMNYLSEIKPKKVRGLIVYLYEEIEIEEILK